MNPYSLWTEAKLLFLPPKVCFFYTHSLKCGITWQRWCREMQQVDIFIYQINENRFITSQAFNRLHNTNQIVLVHCR